MLHLRSLRRVFLMPVLIVLLLVAVMIGIVMYERLEMQSRQAGLASAQLRAEVVYTMLRGRFEYQLLTSQGEAARYRAIQPIIEEESMLLLKNMVADWDGTLFIRSQSEGWSWLWNGHSWQYHAESQAIRGDDWVVSKSFLPWQWTISVRPNVAKITSQRNTSAYLLFLMVLSSWILTALLVSWQMRRLVLVPLSEVRQFLANLVVDKRQAIQLTSSQDMGLLSFKLTELSKRLFEQHHQLQSNLLMLNDERTYIRAVLDAQPAITILTNGIEMVDANESLFRFLPNYHNLVQFKEKHQCICDLFEPYQDPLGHSYFTTRHPNWVAMAIEQDYRVLIKKDDRCFHFMVRTRNFIYQGKQFFVAVFDDITSHVGAELALQQQLLTDTTTQLPNRVKLLKDMQSYSPQGILLVKVLEFGRLNEVYGIHFGDDYLRSFADRLRQECHQLPGLIGPYRLSGSEFAYQLYDDAADATVWQTRAQWLLQDLNRQDLVVWGAQIPVMVSGGFSLWDEEVDEEEQLLLQAAMAINRARKQHLLVLEYDAAWRERQKYQQAQEWLEKVREALAEDRIEPVFQPIYNQKMGVVDKYECLLRLRDHQGQLIAPGLFLNAVRHTSEYLHLTQIMFKKSCAFFAHRQAFFTLNLSEDDFRHANHLQILHDIVRVNGVGNRLTLEVLESEEITSYEQMLTALAPFRELGCGVAIDDFGSGYANFTHISGLQAQVLKIDGSLIQAMAKDEKKANVVLGLVEFGHRMGLLVVAEFVSTNALWQQLSAMGVDGIQGYAVSPPIRQGDLDKPLVPMLE